MRDFRLTIGVSLKGKFAEHGFFFERILETSKTIERKSLKQDYPLNTEFDRLNYFFSAYLSTIHSLKDACQTATGASISWSELSPTYGDFVFYCRNATTHDGSHLINASKGTKNYIIGPLRRIDGRGKVKEFDPPKEDVLSLCCNLTDEILKSLGSFLRRESANISMTDGSDLTKSIQASLMSDFVPEKIKELIRTNSTEIEDSFKGIKIDVVQQTMDAISSVVDIVANARI